MLALTSYAVVVALHVMAVTVAFGFSLLAPVYVPFVRRTHPRALGALHDVQYMIETRVTGPAITLLFLAGVYLASKNDLWSESWVQVPMTLLVAIVIGGVFVIKTIKRMAVLAHAELAGPGDGGPEPGGEYDRLYGRYLIVQSLLCAFVLLAIFFMVAKPS
ncbi:MAG TPA: DUF2269 family protein [Solirubrobacteraceae bacterium]|nr:DUF2269 family protein [Solirubrobacteraceae bacterium]